MREFYKGSGACSPAPFPRRCLDWATAAGRLITQLDSFQRLHDEEDDDSNSWVNRSGGGEEKPDFNPH